MNSYPFSPSPLGLNAQKGYWDWRSGVGTGSLNAAKRKFIIVSRSSSWLSGTSCSSTYSKLSSDITFTKVKLSFSIGNGFFGDWKVENGHRNMRVVKVRKDREERSLRPKSKFSDFGQVRENGVIISV